MLGGGTRGRDGLRAGCRGGPHLMPLCTTRFLQFLQQEHAWLHSKISGGSILLNSWSSRPSWVSREGRTSGFCVVPTLAAKDPQDSTEKPTAAPNPTDGEGGLGEATRAKLGD